jgi:hypothetical protein
MDQYQAVEKAYRDVRWRKCIQSGNSGGGHYLLVFALMQAGICCRGLTSPEIEGVAITYLEKNAKEHHESRI